MNTSLNSVTLATIENYRHAANQAARAYQLGSQRLIHALNGSLEKNVDSRIHSVAPQLGNSIVSARGRVTEIVVKGINEVTKRTEQAVDMGSDNAAAQVKKVTKLVGDIDNSTVAQGLATVARLSLPVAKVGLTVSSKLAEGANALTSAVQAKKAVTPAADNTVKAVARTATRAKRAVATVSSKAVKTVKATAAAPKKAAVRAKRKLA
jgi:hypothetical protein